VQRPQFALGFGAPPTGLLVAISRWSPVVSPRCLTAPRRQSGGWGLVSKFQLSAAAFGDIGCGHWREPANHRRWSSFRTSRTRDFIMVLRPTGCSNAEWRGIEDTRAWEGPAFPSGRQRDAMQAAPPLRGRVMTAKGEKQQLSSNTCTAPVAVYCRNKRKRPACSGGQSADGRGQGGLGVWDHSEKALLSPSSPSARVGAGKRGQEGKLCEAGAGRQPVGSRARLVN
jgi:hypothetical protein